jgi:hypothetical protein
MRTKMVHHLYLSEEEAHILAIFFFTITDMIDEDRKFDMTELLGKIASDSEVYDSYGQTIQIHYND